MKIVTTYVHDDEPCWGLQERERDGRWVQAVYVIRGDAIAEFTTDFGAAEDFSDTMPLMMPSPDGCNTVAQLREHADKNREDSYWANRRREMLAESTLVQDILRQQEEVDLLKRNRTTSGRYATIERNGYRRMTHGR